VDRDPLRFDEHAQTGAEVRHRDAKAVGQGPRGSNEDQPIGYETKQRLSSARLEIEVNGINTTHALQNEPQA
jgi:hypothetical protein